MNSQKRPSTGSEAERLEGALKELARRRREAERAYEGEPTDERYEEVARLHGEHRKIAESLRELGVLEQLESAMDRLDERMTVAEKAHSSEGTEETRVEVARIREEQRRVAWRTLTIEAGLEARPPLRPTEQEEFLKRQEEFLKRMEER